MSHEAKLDALQHQLSEVEAKICALQIQLSVSAGGPEPVSSDFSAAKNGFESGRDSAASETIRVAGFDPSLRPSDPEWGQEQRISDAVLRVLVDTSLMISDEPEISIAKDTIRQLLRANGVTFFAEMDSGQRAVAKEALQMLLSGRDFELEDFMLDMLTMPPGDNRDRACEF